MVPLVEVQSSRTQRPTAGSSYPYVDLTLGDTNTQRVVQLQLEQVLCKHTQGHSSCSFQWSCFVTVLMSVRRAWSCVESSPCRWKTCCLRARGDSSCLPARSPCYNPFYTIVITLSSLYTHAVVESTFTQEQYFLEVLEYFNYLITL